jgi:hypothetical protein
MYENADPHLLFLMHETARYVQYIKDRTCFSPHTFPSLSCPNWEPCSPRHLVTHSFITMRSLSARHLLVLLIVIVSVPEPTVQWCGRKRFGKRVLYENTGFQNLTGVACECEQSRCFAVYCLAYRPGPLQWVDKYVC